MKYVNLKPSFYFYCPNCGCENFITPLSMDDVSPDEREESIRDLLGLAEWESLPEGTEDIEVTIPPEQVECVGCNETFTTEETEDTEPSSDWW